MWVKPAEELADMTVSLRKLNSFCCLSFLYGLELNYRDLLESVQNHITQRLENERDASTAVFQAARIFDSREWPQNREDLALFGNDDVGLLWEKFRSTLIRIDVDREMLMQEWISLKAHVHQTQMQNRAASISTYFTNGLQERFHNILCVYEATVVLPVSSAICERGFSCLKRIKTDWRSSLTTEQLDQLMLISVEGPSLEDYVAERALNRWWTAGQRARRPRFNAPAEGEGEEDDDELINFFLE